MPILVGLANPGPKYAGTRHNVGAEIVRLLAHRHDVKLKRARLGIRADAGDLRVGETRAVLAVPRTFMNESGQAVAPLLRYHRAPLDELIVVHDDIDLPFGKLRVQFGRGPGGNNGVESVIRSVGSRDFWRLKFGVGRPPGRTDPADFVLQRFTAAERSEVDLLVHTAADALEVYLAEGPEAARQAAGDKTAQEPK